MQGDATTSEAAESGAAGIGLFRTELQFMVASTFPRAEAQEGLYRDVLDAARDKPVTFRTIDIGGDKILPYMQIYEEENPALGWRAIRIGLDRPGLLRSQLRAMLRAGAGRKLNIMFPMVAMLEEFDAARVLVERELAHLARHGYEESFSTQIEHGIFDYCGMPRGAKAFIRESENADAAKTGLEAAVAQVVAAVTSPGTS